jgi:hypothetical protein
MYKGDRMKKIVSLSLLGCFLSVYHDAQGMYNRSFARAAEKRVIKSELAFEKRRRNDALGELCKVYPDAEEMHTEWIVDGGYANKNAKKWLDDQRYDTCGKLIDLIYKSCDKRSESELDKASVKKIATLEIYFDEWTNVDDASNKKLLKDALVLAEKRLDKDKQ